MLKLTLGKCCLYQWNVTEDNPNPTDRESMKEQT